MQFKVTNPNAATYTDQVGINEERRRELERMLDNLVLAQVRSVPGGMFSQAMAAFCSGPEEFSYCLIRYCAYHARSGRILGDNSLRCECYPTR